jgi:hypothetical protein
MPSNFKILYLFLLFFTCHCTVEKEFIPIYSSPTLFIRGQIDPNLGVNIFVSKALSTGDTVAIKDLLIKNANISLIDEQNKISQIPFVSDGKYFRDSTGLKIGTGRKFQIKVEVPEFGIAISDWIEIPNLIKMDEIDFGLDGGNNGESATASGSFQFKEPKNTSDHYLLRMYGVIDGIAPISASCEVRISDLCEILHRNGDTCFDDTCLGDTELYSGEIYADAESYFPALDKNKKYKEVVFVFGKANKSYYDFLNSLNQPEEWEKGLSEPKKSFTNIKGGFGIFFASNTQSKKIPL